jgi:hypothetical protein
MLRPSKGSYGKAAWGNGPRLAQPDLRLKPNPAKLGEPDKYPPFAYAGRSYRP